MMIQRSKFTAQQLARIDEQIQYVHGLDPRPGIHELADLKLGLIAFKVQLDFEGGGNRQKIALQISASNSRMCHVIGARSFGDPGLQLSFLPGYSNSTEYKTSVLKLADFAQAPYIEYDFGMCDPASPLFFEIEGSHELTQAVDMVLVCSMPSSTMLDASFRDPKIKRLAQLVRVLDGAERTKAEAAELLVMLDKDRRQQR